MELRNNYNSGFTLIEILVTLGIVILALSFTLNIGFDTYNRTGFHTEVKSVVRLLQHARGQAIANIDGVEHSFAIDVSDDEYIVYGGANPHDDTKAIFIPIREGVDVAAEGGGDVDITFRQNSGRSNGGVIEVRHGSSTQLIEVNQEGAIIW